MSERSATLAYSPALLLGEWTARYKGYLPQERRDGKTQDIVWAGEYVDLVSERWVYVLTETASGDYDIPYELYVDDKGRIWVNQTAIFDPISERKNPVRGGGLAVGGFSFPRVDLHGRALWVRLLSASFRLPSATTRRLLDEDIRTQTRRHVAPLWTWIRGSDETVLRSAEGLSLQETPLVLSIPSDSPYADGGPVQRVAAACNPFSLVTNLSHVFLRRYAQFAERFEPENPPDDGEFQKMAFCSALEQAFGQDAGGRARTEDFLDWKRIYDALDDYRGEMKAAIERYETPVVSMSLVLRSPLFRLVQEASLDEECFEGDESPGWKAHSVMMFQIHRNLDRSAAGQQLLADWAQASINEPEHPLNTAFWPYANPTKSQIKMYRWGSKGIMGVWATQVAYRVAVAKANVAQHFIDHVLFPTALATQDWSETLFDLIDGTLTGRDATGIRKIRYLEEVVIPDAFVAIHFQRKMTAAERSAAKKGARPAISPNRPAPLFKQRLVAENFVPDRHGATLEAWYEAGGDLKYGKYEHLFGEGSSFKTVNAAFLDAINLAFAVYACYEAYEDERKSSTDFNYAAGNSLAHATNLTVSILQWRATEEMKNAKELRGVKLGVRGLGLAFLKLGAGVFFSFQNWRESRRAGFEGDEDRALALAVASGGEAWSAILSFAGAFAFSTPLGVAAAIVTVVTAGAYIAAEVLKDDEVIEQFLRVCAWGSGPYEHPEPHPRWSPSPVRSWARDFPGQQILLTRILHRIEVSWASYGQELLGLKVHFAGLTPTSSLHVRYEATLADGTPRSGQVEFQRAQLPLHPPALLSVPMAPGIGTDGLPVFLVATVTFHIGEGFQPETVEFLMKSNAEYFSEFPRNNLRT